MALEDGTLIDKEALDALMALVPEDKRTEAQSHYSRVHDSGREAVTQVREQETALQRWHAQLRTWATTKETQFAERERQVKPTAGTPPAGAEPPVAARPAATTGLTPDQVQAMLDERLEQFGRMVVGAGSEQTVLQQRHQQLYNGTQIFNPEELYRHPLARTHGLSAAFEEIHKAKIAESAEAARTKAESDIRADERRKVQEELAARGGQNLPFPTPGEDDSAIGIIERRNAESKDVYGPEAASRFYQQKQMTGAFPA